MSELLLFKAIHSFLEFGIPHGFRRCNDTPLFHLALSRKLLAPFLTLLSCSGLLDLVTMQLRL